jgi:hypothetical protein
MNLKFRKIFIWFKLKWILFDFNFYLHEFKQLKYLNNIQIFF